MNEVLIVENRRYGWIVPFVTFLFGICLLVITYMMYTSAKWEDEMSAHLPVVCMKINYGTEGLGTVKYPDRIYAEYLGTTYNFSMGRKYYRSLSGVDTIAVHFDPASGKAFLPTTSARVKHYTGLYILFAAGGLVLIGGGVWEFVKIFKKRV